MISEFDQDCCVLFVTSNSLIVSSMPRSLQHRAEIFPCKASLARSYRFRRALGYHPHHTTKPPHREPFPSSSVLPMATLAPLIRGMTCVPLQQSLLLAARCWFWPGASRKPTIRSSTLPPPPWSRFRLLLRRLLRPPWWFRFPARPRPKLSAFPFPVRP